MADTVTDNAASTSSTRKKPLLRRKALWVVPFLVVFVLIRGGIVNVIQLQRFYLTIQVLEPVVTTEVQSWTVNFTTNITTLLTTSLPKVNNNRISVNHTMSSASEDRPPSSPSRNVNISIVVVLAGELGNHLFRLAGGYSIQRILQDEYGLHSHFVLQHQMVQKWVKPARDLKDCFPYFRSMDFTLGNSEEFRQRLQQQENWLGEQNTSKLVFSGSTNVRRGLNYLMEILTTATPPEIDTTANISLPFIMTRAGANWDFVDSYFDGLKRLFAFDDNTCCKDLPDPDEHVFVSSCLSLLNERAFQEVFATCPDIWSSHSFCFLSIFGTFGRNYQKSERS